MRDGQPRLRIVGFFSYFTAPSKHVWANSWADRPPARRRRSMRTKLAYERQNSGKTVVDSERAVHELHGRIRPPRDRPTILQTGRLAAIDVHSRCGSAFFQAKQTSLQRGE